MTFPHIQDKFLGHEFHVFCEWVFWASVLSNLLPTKAAVRSATRAWPLSRMSRRTRSYLVLMYEIGVDMVALLAINLRYRVPSLDLEFFGFCKKQFDNWRERIRRSRRRKQVAHA